MAAPHRGISSRRGGAWVHSSSSSRLPARVARPAPACARARARCEDGEGARRGAPAAKWLAEGRPCARARARGRSPRGGGGRARGAAFGDERGAVVVGGAAEQAARGKASVGMRRAGRSWQPHRVTLRMRASGGYGRSPLTGCGGPWRLRCGSSTTQGGAPRAAHPTPSHPPPPAALHRRHRELTCLHALAAGPRPSRAHLPAADPLRVATKQAGQDATSSTTCRWRTPRSASSSRRSSRGVSLRQKLSNSSSSARTR